jgi:ubiquitin C-terminal hydrolase
MNAVLQCLLNTPGWLAEACRAFDLPGGQGAQQSSKALLGRCFAQLTAEYNSTQGQPLGGRNAALRNMKAAIADLDPQYAGCEPQDAYEFLGCLLEGLEENFRALFLQGDVGPAAGVIRAVCGVTTHTSRTCHACSKRFDVDQVTDTALRLPLLSQMAQVDPEVRQAEEQRTISLEELLEAARSPETIQGYDCDSCRECGSERSSATQEAGIISSTRDVLAVVLYRFCHAMDESGRFKAMKVRRKVACPTQLVLPTGDYRLFGMVSHVGAGLSTGHYVAAVQGLRDGVWYECDDTKVSPLKLQALYSGRPIAQLRDGADPYILFYRLEQDIAI